jgi:hypothetical protein
MFGSTSLSPVIIACANSWLVYRRLRDRESIVAAHSVNTAAGGGGVRWYEFRVNGDRTIGLHQQGTYAPDKYFRWMASPAIDRAGNIGIGYSFEVHRITRVSGLPDASPAIHRAC